MIRHIKYYYKDCFFSAIVFECFYQALKDGVSELLVDENDYDIIVRTMVNSGLWNWDRVTFMGMKIIIIK